MGRRGVFEGGKSGAGGRCYSGIVWRRPPKVGVKIAKIALTSQTTVVPIREMGEDLGA